MISVCCFIVATCDDSRPTFSKKREVEWPNIPQIYTALYQQSGIKADTVIYQSQRLSKVWQVNTLHSSFTIRELVSFFSWKGLLRRKKLLRIITKQIAIHKEGWSFSRIKFSLRGGTMCAGFVRITYLSLMIYLSSSCSIGGRREEIILHPDGGYDFMVSINKDVPEERELITKLQVGNCEMCVS